MRLPVIPVVHENANIFCFTFFCSTRRSCTSSSSSSSAASATSPAARLFARFFSIPRSHRMRNFRYWSRAARASSAGWWPFSRHSFFAKSKVRASVTLSGGNKSVLRYEGHDAQLPEEQHASCGSTHTLFLLSVQHGVVDSFPFAVEQSKPLPSGPGSKHSSAPPGNDHTDAAQGAHAGAKHCPSQYCEHVHETLVEASANVDCSRKRPANLRRILRSRSTVP